MKIRALAIAGLMFSAISTAYADAAAQQRALDAISANTGDRFRSMTWNGDLSLWLMRHDIGSDQTEMANFVCSLLEQSDYPDWKLVTVTIFDLSGKKALGKAMCRQL